jgi:type IV secretory pathway TrbD component
VTPSEPEAVHDGPEPPPGVLLEYPPSTIVRIQVRISAGAQALMSVPRLLLLLAAVVLVLESWKHHLFIAFWFLGLPFLRWLRGARQTRIVVREREIELESQRWFGGPLVLPRNVVASIEIGRSGFTRLYRRALVVRLKDRRVGWLFVGLSAEQAEFVNGGLQRWLAADF